MDRKTPLYDEHVKLGGKIVPFAGWLLPVQYSGVIAEHMAVRTACGLFDVSHMGEIACVGDDALLNLNRLLTNDYTEMEIGQARYSPMCNEQGGVVDDLIVYKKADDRYLIVVNAANKDKDFNWMLAHQTGSVELTDISDEVAQLALQGPKAEAILRKLASPGDIPEKYYTCNFDRMVSGVKCIVSRTGYTGEDGFELYMASGDAVKMWNLLLEAGKDEGLLPCGLGARDTLRLEAAMPLYGHEMTDEISPLEAGLAWAVKPEHAFIGREPMLRRGTPRARVGLKITGKGIAREGQDVFLADEKIGAVTSGTHLPYLGGAYAMALVSSEHAQIGTVLDVDVRGRRVSAEIVPLPFYKRQK